MEALGTFTGPRDATDMRFERRYPRAIETVWAALTDPARLADWLGPALVEPHVGGRYELFTDRPRPMHGRIRTWDPPYRLEYSWNHNDAPESVVRCDLTRDGDGTLLVFTHSGVGFGWLGLMLPGWHVYFERLRSLLDGAGAPLSMQRWRDVQAVYLARCALDGTMIDLPSARA